MDNFNSDELLQQKLEAMRQADREENPPSPPHPLPMELQSEIKIATNLLKLIFKTENQPLIFSPSAISKALTLLITDVDEVAGKEIEEILGIDLIYNKKSVKDFFYSNHLYYSKNLTLLRGSKECGNYFQSIDFNDKAATEKINDIVSNDTNEKISKLIEACYTTKNISTCLGNAATFEGRFRLPFSERRSSMFYSNPPRIVDLLYQKEGVGWSYAKGEDWKCLGIPYNGSERKLFILLPIERNGLENLIRKFDFSEIEKYIYGMSCEAIAAIPVFEVELQIILNDHLKEMGFNKMFSKDSLSHLFSDNQPHSVDLAVHSSKIGVDGYGTYTEPFGYSDGRCMASWPVIDFVADHPFIFFIADFKYQKFKSLHFVGTFS